MGKYCERVSIDQLDEIEDFPTEAKQFFIIDNPSPRQLNVNAMTLNELKRHPDALRDILIIRKVLKWCAKSIF